jgi:hypothetical protein
MNRVVAGLLIAIAALATGVGVWAGGNLEFAAPAATTAVLAAGLLLVGVWLDRRPAAPAVPVAAPPRDEFLFRFGFRSGRLGREEVLSTLDRIERTGPNPNLPARSSEEIASVVGLPRADFREYVRRRVQDLEDRS